MKTEYYYVGTNEDHEISLNGLNLPKHLLEAMIDDGVVVAEETLIIYWLSDASPEEWQIKMLKEYYCETNIEFVIGKALKNFNDSSSDFWMLLDGHENSTSLRSLTFERDDILAIVLDSDDILHYQLLLDNLVIECELLKPTDRGFITYLKIVIECKYI